MTIRDEKQKRNDGKKRKGEGKGKNIIEEIDVEGIDTKGFVDSFTYQLHKMEYNEMLAGIGNRDSETSY